MAADRLDQPADARAVDVLGILHGQAGEIFRPVDQLAVELLGQGAVVDHDQPGLDRLAELRLVGLLQLAGRSP